MATPAVELHRVRLGARLFVRIIAWGLCPRALWALPRRFFARMKGMRGCEIPRDGRGAPRTLRAGA